MGQEREHNGLAPVAALSVVAVFAAFVSLAVGIFFAPPTSDVDPAPDAEPGLTALAETSEPPLIELPAQPAVTRSWPRVKPASDPAERLRLSIDPGQRLLASSRPVAFTSNEDFTGGRESLFAGYRQARARDRMERAYATVVLSRGVGVADTLAQLGGSEGDIAAALEAVTTVAPIDALEPGMPLDYAFSAAGSAPRLERLRFRPDPRHVVTVHRAEAGYEASMEEIAVERRFAATAGVIRSSLFAAAGRSNVPQDIMVRFANLFLYDIDFARDIQRGDRFEIVYEAFYDEFGQYVGSGEILFAGMTWRGQRQAKGYYRFEEAAGMDQPYFDANGESATRLLMKTPIEGARVTSHFGLRRHPTLGYTKTHKGVDFGAPTGTPIMAAGDGVIDYAGPAGTFGNYIRIEHRSGFKTAYAHLHGFAAGMKKGKAVRQGEIIGYVGSTGRSTGPHLHYEVHKGDDVQNPMTLDVATGRVIDDALAAPFQDHRLFVDSVRVTPLTIASAE